MTVDAGPDNVRPNDGVPAGASGVLLGNGDENGDCCADDGADDDDVLAVPSESSPAGELGSSSPPGGGTSYLAYLGSPERIAATHFPL